MEQNSRATNFQGNPPKQNTPNSDPANQSAPPENVEMNINRIATIVDSITSTVNEEKRKQKVCVHWLK